MKAASVRVSQRSKDKYMLNAIALFQNCGNIWVLLRELFAQVDR